MAGMLITFGYATRGAEKMLADLMKSGTTILADIRDTPYCAWSDVWNPSALRAAYPRRYWPLRELGNVNHNNRQAGVRLRDQEKGIELLLGVLARRNVIIMCACAGPGCHRFTVARIVAAQAPEIDIRHACAKHS